MKQTFNNNRVTESENIQKNGVSPKNRMKRRNILKLIVQELLLKKDSKKHKWQKREGNISHRENITAHNISGNMTKDIGNHWKSSEYYSKAEEWTDVFWNKDTVFYKCFEQLDCSAIVELACGQGRHVQKYIKKSKAITLVDINQENIDFCKKRYEGEQKISYIINSGDNFSEIKTNSQTAIFTYDSMVHFEMSDILSYIKDANRILVNGGKILFHHSNADFNPELNYTQKPHSRNFMSADIFAYLALRNGFNILSQDVFSWGGSEKSYPDIDCLSLCQKIRDI
jgi:ubiquinone/menaquinone biosynthesis C-methylase UbiE